MKPAAMLLLCCLLVSACSTTNGRKGMGPRPGTPEYAAQANSGEPKPPPSCSSWLNRGRAGGTVGSVVGFVVASAIGSPVLGLLYQAAGYGAGFAAADKCKKAGSGVATTPAQKTSDGTVAPHASPAAANIIEEELE